MIRLGEITQENWLEAARLERGETYAGTTDLGVYDKARFVVAVPARSTWLGWRA